MAERYLVTAALPYANGPIHIGHAVGCYVPADVYARFHRLRGDDVIYICGADEHGTPISVSAEKEGVSPKDIVDKYNRMQLKAFEGIGVQFTNYSGTARDIHIRNSQDFFKTLLEKGYIFEQEVLRPYCPDCGRFLPDRYVKGECPKCGSKDERGDQCEKCGTQLEPGELVNPYCSICGGTPEMVKTRHWYFKLKSMSPELKEWVEKNDHWPANARNFALGWIREGLKDRAITRDIDWGVPVPVEGAEGKVLYVWFDAPIGYISSTMEWAKAQGDAGLWERYWKDPDTKIVHFIGKDNIPFHAIIWPAMLKAHGGYTLPYQIASNEYLNLEGKKMSTSRGWVLWLQDCIDEFDPEAVRYYLLSITPQSSDSDFSLTDFKERVNNELISTLGNLVNRVVTFLEKEGGVVPEPAGFDEEDRSVFEFMKTQPDEVANNIERLNFINGLSSMMALAHEGNRYFQKKEPWKNDPANTLYVCVNLLRTISIVSWPFLPKTSERIWEMLGFDGSVAEQSWDSAKQAVVPAGHRIQGGGALFEKIDDARLEEFSKKYLNTLGGPGKSDEKEETKLIDFDRFKEVDLRIATILDVEDHPNADKLYKLRVSLGEEGERTLVAGVKASYSRDELVGRQIVVVSNLAPAKIRGVESQGMLLAAEDEEGKPIILSPESKARPGSRIR